MTQDKTLVRFAAFLALFLLVSPFLPRWALFMLTLAGANGLVVLGLLLFLRAGLISFGQALYFCTGAYATGMMGQAFGITDAFVLLAASGVAGGLVAFVLGFLLSKYRGIFFGLLSLAFSMILYGLLAKTESLGSTDGFNVPAVTLLGWVPEQANVRVTVLALTFGVMLLALGFVNTLLRSPRGLLLTAIRDNEIRAEYMGASARRTIHLIYVIAGVLAGLGGSLAAITVGHIDPTMAFWTTSGEFIFIAILGGIGSVVAPFLGAMVFGIIHTVAFANSPNTWQMTIGIALIGVILLLPDGLWSLVARLKGRKA